MCWFINRSLIVNPAGYQRNPILASGKQFAWFTKFSSHASLQKLLSLPTQILLSARYLSLPHLCLLCGRGRWHAFAARICLITTVGLGCLLKVTCQPSCQIFSFFLGHMSQMRQQRNKREEGSALFQILLSVGIGFAQPWLAGSCHGMSQRA